MDKDFVYLGDSLSYFFNHAKINIYQGSTAINLMNLFPFLKGRYSIVDDTLDNILNIYLLCNDLYHPEDDRFIIADDLMVNAFGGDIPAVAYKYANEKGGLALVSMNIAVKR